MSNSDKKEFVVTDKLVVMNFSEVFCKTSSEVLNSKCFVSIWSKFVDHIYKIQKQDALALFDLVDNPKDDFINLFKLLLSFKVHEIKEMVPSFKNVLELRDTMYDLVDTFYDYWRFIERYGVIFSKYKAKGVDSSNFVESTNSFNAVVLKTYRTISERLYGSRFAIYRQLPAGVNAALLLNKMPWMDKKSVYSVLRDASFIESIIIRPPFISYSHKNKRTGVYPEVFENPIKNLSLDPDDFYCYPAYVGSALAFVYFHRDYLSHGITLCNLFQFVQYKDCVDKKPDLLYIFGAEMEGDSKFYHDKENDIFVGVAPHNDSIDYFGYMKKMLLTLYNVKMIASGYLPIHGACVNITLKDGSAKNVVIIGDSGAGKSESLDALSTYAGDNISNMQTIFDDMGTFKIVDNQVYAYGTEIGAFVRLDDMTSGYAYKEMDRAIFMNPDKINSRLVIPVATYPQIMKGYKVDMCLYANNYENKEDAITFFDNKEDALQTFIRGARKAKGTTGEVGLVESFFANPFGPVQKEKETRVLLDKYFSTLFDNKIMVGEINTKLAVLGYEYDGPAAAAKRLFEIIEK